jgi:hypothetical protein
MNEQNDVQQKLDALMSDESLSKTDRQIILAALLLNDALNDLIAEKKPDKQVSDFWNSSRFMQN